MIPRFYLRIAVIFVIVSSGTYILSTNDFSPDARAPYSTFKSQSELPPEHRDKLAPPRDGLTAITTHGGAIIVLNPNGTLRYFNDTHSAYWDVDPIRSGQGVHLLYTATDVLGPNETACNPVPQRSPTNHCIQQSIEILNLSTGQTEVLYSRIDPRATDSEWHDVDKVSGSNYIVADMYSDSVFIVNSTTRIIIWEWNVQGTYSIDSGGPYPQDWVHLNDVDVLDDGRIQVSLRNQDQVIFLDRQNGINHSWTLGEENNHDILYNQHNPDYVPGDERGPAVIVADSENNRIVEYHRSNGTWNRTWIWRDRQLQWPRDADRLRNGHTLITDTLGGRIIEIDKEGNITWGIDVFDPYEAERFQSGTDGSVPTAKMADLKSRSVESNQTEVDDFSVRIRYQIKSLFPNKIINAVQNSLPGWVGFYDLIVIVLNVIITAILLSLELWWSDWTVRKPVIRRR